jgi:hypothetical protein
MKVYTVKLTEGKMDFIPGYQLQQNQLGKEKVWVQLGYKVPKKSAHEGDPLQNRKCVIQRIKDNVNKEVIEDILPEIKDNGNDKYLNALKESLPEEEATGCILFVPAEDGQDRIRIIEGYDLRRRGQLLEGVRYYPELGTVPAPSVKKPICSYPSILVMQPFESYILGYYTVADRSYHRITFSYTDEGITVTNTELLPPKHTKEKRPPRKDKPSKKPKEKVQDKSSKPKPAKFSKHKGATTRLGDIFNLKEKLKESK